MPDPETVNSDSPLPQSNEKERLEQIEAEARINKLLQEQEKLKLERQALTRQLSWQGILLEWLKATTVPAALAGVLVTFLVGLGQVRETAETRDAERFDRALTRLASTNPTERMTGISGLRLFLASNAQQTYAATLHFLVNAVSSEKDVTVNCGREKDPDRDVAEIAA